MILEQLFGGGGEIGWAHECARAILIFFYGLALVRLVGRRVFGKWSALDIIVSIMAGSNLSRAMTGSAGLWDTLAATTLLMVLHWLLSHLAARSHGLSQLLEGHPQRLGENGRVDERQLLKHAVSNADLHEALHNAQVEAVAGARLIVLEPSGKISVLKQS